MDPLCCEYLDFIQADNDVRQKPKFIRGLYGLSQKMTPALFIATLSRALRYKVSSLEALQRISRQLLQNDLPECMEESILNQDYEQREAYQTGRFSRENASAPWLDVNADQEETST